MLDKINYTANGNSYNDYFNNSVHGEYFIYAVAYNCKKNNSGHNSRNGGNKISWEAAARSTPEKAYKVNGENWQSAYNEQGGEAFVELHIEYFFARLGF